MEEIQKRTQTEALKLKEKKTWVTNSTYAFIGRSTVCIDNAYTKSKRNLVRDYENVKWKKVIEKSQQLLIIYLKY